MRTFRIALLAAALAGGLPGAVFAQDRGDRGQDRGNGRGERSDGPAGPRFNADRGDAGDRFAGPPGGGRPDREPDGSRDRQFTPPEPRPSQQAQGAQDRPDMRGDDRRDQGRNPGFSGRPDGAQRDGGRFDGRQGFGQRNDNRFDGRFDGGRPGNGPRGDDRRFDGRPGGNFATDRRPGLDRAWRPGYNWRADRGYDWRGYRNSNRGVFQVGRYYAPRGWNQGYRRFGIGNRLPSFFFAQNYWLNDPYDYRLPPAYGQYRWIRYYNDVLLVDLRTGAIVDQIPDFFW